MFLFMRRIGHYTIFTGSCCKVFIRSVCVSTMSRRETPVFVLAAVFFLAIGALLPAFPQSARSMNFLKPKIERGIEKTLPGFDVSIEQVSASRDKGIVIKGFSLSAAGSEVLRAREISVDYVSIGAFVSSAVFENLSSSAVIEAVGVEAFLSQDTWKMFSALTASGYGKKAESEGGGNGLLEQRLPEMTIRDSIFNLYGKRVEVHESGISFARGKDAGEFKIALKNGHISMPDRGLSVKDLSLTSMFLKADGMKFDSVNGGGFFTTPRGNTQADFGIHIPKDKSNAVWEGWLSLSEFSLMNRTGEASFNYISFERDGVLSIHGNVSLGSLSSRIKTVVKTVGGVRIPELGAQNDFEVEGDIFGLRYIDNADNSLPLGGIKVRGDIKKKDDLLIISGKLSEDYNLGLFDVGVRLEKSDFQISLKNYKIDSANLLVRSSNFLARAEIETSDGAGTEVKYDFESKNVFHLSKRTRSLRGYHMSGAVISSGRLRKQSDGKLFVSGKVELEDFSATIGERIQVGRGEADFTVPVSNFPFENAVVKLSMEDISYGGISAEKFRFGVDRKIYAGFEFGDGRFFDFVADLYHEDGGVYANVKRMELKANDFKISLSRNFTANIFRKNVAIENLALRGKDSHLLFSGSYERGDEQNDLALSARFSGLSTEFFEHFYRPLGRYRGFLSGEISVDGSVPWWPVVDIDVKYQGASGDARGDLSIVREDFSDFFSVDLSFEEKTGGALEITGEISPADGKPAGIESVLKDIPRYDLTLKAKKFNIKPIHFLSKKIQNLEGAFSGNLSVFKDGDDTGMNGIIDIDSARVSIHPWTELIDFESAQIIFNKDEISSSFQVRDSYGEVKGKGNFNVRDFSYSCDLSLEGMYLRIKYLHSGFHGNLSVSGSGRNIRIRGDKLKTEGGEVWIKRNYNVGVAGLVFIDSPDGGADGEFSKGGNPGFFTQTSDLNFYLDISGDTKFKLDRVNSLLNGRLHILRKPGDDFSAVKGDLSLLRGSYSLFGKQFAIDKGSVSISSRAHLSPIVNISALYQGSGLSVKVNLYGETDDLKLSLSSIPAMKEDEIVLELLLDGRQDSDRRYALDIMKTVRNDGTTGYDTALGYAADELASSIFESNLFTFVDVFNISREGAGIFDSEIEVGGYLTDRFYFAYERVNETLPISVSYKNRFTAEYKLSEHFVLEGVAGGLAPGINLLFNFDFR